VIPVAGDDDTAWRLDSASLRRLPGEEGRPYVPAVLSTGTLVFVSGQTPLRDGALGATVGEQTRAALQNVGDVLRAAGAGLENVVRCGVFITDLSRLPEFNEAYTEAFGDTLPARTAVGATLPGYFVEIDCVAIVPQT
jgi:2-iminobutanoate/2-iminopropanoate deaminase